MKLTYNERLLPTRYELSNVRPAAIYPTVATMGTENQYYADGRIHYARDLQDGTFDRKYDYDQAARLKEAYSGREARGLPPLTFPDNPFRQSYSYDVWNNLGRTGKHWTAPVSDTPTYTNNRRPDLTFDANGSVTWDYNYETHAYDAAGRQISFHDADTTFFGGGSWILNEYTIAHIYDGNGQAGKRVETRSSADENGPIESSTETSYNLRSTVLGGALIAKLNQWGGRDEGHIYAGGQELATYYGVAPNAYINALRHTNPTTGNWIKTGGNGHAVRTELDPLGADVSTTNPYVSNLSYADIMGTDNLYYQRGNALDIRGGCALNGMPIPCWLANEAMASPSGAVGVDPTSLSPSKAAELGLVPIYGSDTRKVSSGGMEITYETTEIIGYTSSGLMGGGVNLRPTIPQNPYDPRVDFRDYAEGLAKNNGISDCQKLALMIYKAGQVFGGSNPFSDSGRGIIHGLMAGLTEYTSVASGGREGPSNPNYRVGVFTRDPHYGGGFGDSGFSAAFQDVSNQVRHFTFYLGAGWGVGSTLANQGLYREEGTKDPRVADVGLGLAATDLGSRFNGNYTQLAQDVWHRVCGQSGDLKLP